jgi:hypothetical protein
MGISPSDKEYELLKKQIENVPYFPGKQNEEDKAPSHRHKRLISQMLCQ